MLITPLIFIQCQRNTENLSQEKNITAVTFKVTDNPGITNDIAGVISADTIKFEFPSNTAINNLVPTIDYTGNKIEPANKTAQDFTNGVQYKVTAEDGSSNTYFFKLTKTSTDTATIILGTWKVLKDSVTNDNWINPRGTYLIPGVYIGKAQDFWRFETNGVFTGRENNVQGSDTYKVLPNQKLDIPIWTVQYGLGTIEVINNKEFAVYFSATSTNGGKYYRKVYLKR